MRGGGIAGVQALGRVRVIAAPTTSPPGGNGTVAQQAFGANTDVGQPSSARSALHPAGAFGMKFWLGVAAIGGLWWVYYHLPE